MAFGSNLQLLVNCRSFPALPVARIRSQVVSIVFHIAAVLFPLLPIRLPYLSYSSTSDGMSIFGTLPKSEDLDWHRSEDEEFWTKVDEVVVPLESRMTYPPTIEIGSCMQSSARSVPHYAPFNALWRGSHRLRHLVLVDVPQIVLDQLSQYCASSKQFRILALVCSATISPPLIFEYPSFLTNLHLTSIYITTAPVPASGTASEIL
ncbi:hypothetical protein B0H14DRAFT_3489714 [Mycena olivaceomarginata]|nr:hypothetical protein B0H14DRAFT_3489714 [Mycena olivaceomarginata]